MWNYDLSMKNLTNFQTTRFTNSARFVFINLRADYAALRQAFENVIKSKTKSTSSYSQGKTVDGEAIRRTVNSWKFCLNFSGCADIYNIYGLFANICQLVNTVRHQRYNQVLTLNEKFLTMIRFIDHLNYPVSSDNENNSFWLRFYKDLETTKKEGIYMVTKIDHIGSGHKRLTCFQSLHSGSLEIAGSL